jgi:ubiquinone/menaquinone biosynthesis C-methylase UbiE
MTHEMDLSGNPAENYERYFVPAIGLPVALDLIEVAALAPGERVLDVACGTGIVTRLAAETLNDAGSVSGLDVNPGMLAVAREAAPENVDIVWYEASAEAMPLPERAFDVVLCQMGLQFMPDRVRALREMRRVLDADGRLVLNVPGPTPPALEILADALARHIDRGAAPFVHTVFSLHEAEALRQLAREAGFEHVNVMKTTKPLKLPPASDFMWQYIHSTPLAEFVEKGNDEQRLALEEDVCRHWRDFSSGDGLAIEVGITTLAARH